MPAELLLKRRSSTGCEGGDRWAGNLSAHQSIMQHKDSNNHLVIIGSPATRHWWEEVRGLKQAALETPQHTLRPHTLKEKYKNTEIFIYLSILTCEVRLCEGVNKATNIAAAYRMPEERDRGREGGRETHPSDPYSTTSACMGRFIPESGKVITSI